MRTTTARKPILHAAIAAASLASCGVPATAAASPTPAAPAPAAPAPATSVTIAATPTPEPAQVVAGGTLTVRASPVAMLGQTLLFSGAAPRRDARRTVLIERLQLAEPEARWVTVATARVDRHGAFLARWRTDYTGRVAIRALALPTTTGRAARRGERIDSSATAQITVYRPAFATWFGPDFYGKQTACGQTMTPLLLGLANRTIPCGTLVEVSYAGRSLVLPVIDRGPYANGADWDLTAGAAAALGVLETVRLGTLVVGSAPNTPTLGVPPGAQASEVASATAGGALAS
jgi:rare lipoprotein A